MIVVINVNETPRRQTVNVQRSETWDYVPSMVVYYKAIMSAQRILTESCGLPSSRWRFKKKKKKEKHDRFPARESFHKPMWLPYSCKTLLKVGARKKENVKA